jgi:hypothetical protein
MNFGSLVMISSGLRVSNLALVSCGKKTKKKQQKQKGFACQHQVVGVQSF